MVELLSPVGDFNCLKAAVQNGADSVYFGADSFSARAFASNFTEESLKDVIEYAKIRGVKTHLTLNTLIKDHEFKSAFLLAQKAYESGIDAIIVQDLGLATTLIKEFPDLPIHASTQMTVHNLNGALALQNLGFKRVVLSRELSINDIDYICKNTNLEIETFIHGALCVSYSGQCLFSSMLGGRSGNRGKCAGPCRLPFTLLEDHKPVDSGYLLSTRDLCGLEYIPALIHSGVRCFKIEGRMKNPEYVATVTRIYRKYIDLALSNFQNVIPEANKKVNFLSSPILSNRQTISENDKKDLLQVFNRGMASSGHFDEKGNHNLVFKDKPNNTGLFLGKIQKYSAKKGYVTIKLNEKILIGDTVSLEKENSSYTISELMDENLRNITDTKIGQTVIIGRIKGNIKLGNSIYKMSSKALNTIARDSIAKENKKIGICCNLSIKLHKPIEVHIKSDNNLSLYQDLNIKYISDFIPEKAINHPLDKETIIRQLEKTSNSPFYFKTININLEENLFLPKLSILNELRRIILEKVAEYAKNKISRRNPQQSSCLSDLDGINNTNIKFSDELNESNIPIIRSFSNHKKQNYISLLLNILNLEFDYSKLEGVDYIYIPLKYFSNKKYSNILELLSNKFQIYIYMPTIIKSNYKNIFLSNVENAVEQYNVKGVIISNICNIKLLENLKEEKTTLEIIANYTFNIFNTHSVQQLKDIGVLRYTISPELDKNAIINLCNSNILANELIVYGKTPLLNMNYCPLGETDKCYPNCKMRCKNEHTYMLRDRYKMDFRIIPDNLQTVTTIYNSKITSISAKDFNVDVVRIDVLDETINEINDIISTVKNNKRFEGKLYTNGNLNREI